MRMTLLPLLPLLLTSLSQAANAPSAALLVRGRIGMQACKLDIGLRDSYPFIPYAHLNAGRPTVLSPKYDDVTITCPSTAKVGLSFKDNFAASKEPDLAADGVPADFGLAPHQRYRVGALALQVFEVQGDRHPLVSLNAIGGQWRDDRGTVLASTIVGWIRSDFNGAREPGAFQQITARLRVTPIIVRRENLPRGSQIGIEARLTSELHYL